MHVNSDFAKRPVQNDSLGENGGFFAVLSTGASSHHGLVIQPTSLGKPQEASVSYSGGYVGLVEIA